MNQKIMTKFEIIVIEFDKTGYYYPKYKTKQTIIAETIEEAREKAIERTPMKHGFGSGWVQKTRIIKSEDIVLNTNEL